MAERLINGEVERADEFDNVPVGAGGEAFFKFVDAVEVAVFGETGDAVEVVSLEFMLGGVLDHVPLDGVLGVVILHVPFVAAAEEIYNLGAVEHEHGGREGHRGATRHYRLGDHEFDFAFFVEEVVHLFVIGEGLVGEIAAGGGGFGDLFEDV